MKKETTAPPDLLVVDSSEQELDELKKYLKNTEANLITAQKGAEALQKTGKAELALAIIEADLPDMSCLKLAREIGNASGNEKVPVIFVHADNSELVYAWGKQFEQADYLARPVNKDLLLSKTRLFLELFSQKQTIRAQEQDIRLTRQELNRTYNSFYKCEEKYKILLKASPDGIFIINLDGIVTDVSEISLDLLGSIDREEIIGENIFSYIPDSEKNNVREVIDKTLNEGFSQDTEIKFRKKDNSLFLGELRATLIQNKMDKSLSLMLVLRDISYQKIIEKKQKHNDRMASIGQMATGIAHEINQPLNTISLTLDKLYYRAASTEYIKKDYFVKKMNKIFQNIERVKNIIDHIRAFSRSEDKQMPAFFNINNSIENALSLISEQLKHKAIAIDLNLAAHIPKIKGSTYRFEQVVLNLLLNAKDALLEKQGKQEQGFDMRIRVSSYLENRHIVVEIADNGIGINEDDYEQIMLPFYTTKETGKGTGIGLYISYQIIEEMNGTIELTSKPHEGTTFKILLKNKAENK